MSATRTEPREAVADVETVPRTAPGPGRHSAPPRPRAPLPGGVFVTAWVLLAVSALTFGAFLYALVLSGVQEHRSQVTLYATLRNELVSATVPFGGSIPGGTPIAVIDAPTAGLHRAVLVEGTTSSALTRGPGHRSDTPMPGQPGVSVLMGRSATFGAPFGRIASMKAGDPIDVTTGQGAFVYRVDRVRHPGDPVPSPPTATESRLVLMTSYATGWRGGWAPYQTVLVDASLVGKTQPAPAGRPTAVAPAAQPMKGETAALVPLLLWLEAAVLVAIGIVWCQRRWGARQTWLAGVPVLLAVLWGTAQTAILLLPNLI